MRKQLSGRGSVPLGPYVLALDHTDESLSLIDARSFRKQLDNGADMESLGVVYVGTKEQAAFFTPNRCDQ